MITRKEYKEANDIIKQYENEKSSEIVNDYTCIICEKNIIKPVKGEYPNPIKQDNAMWDNGVLLKITPGYGSDFDLNNYYGAICDNCLRELITKKLIINKKQITKDYLHKVLDAKF